MAQVTYLLDTNIWLERLLAQDQAKEVANFLSEVPSGELAITDFSLHSIGLILTRLNQPNAFKVFLDSLFAQGAVAIVCIDPIRLGDVMDAINTLGLDFDDAYQYMAANTHNLILVSFDTDFDNTPLKRLTPGQALTRRQSK